MRWPLNRQNELSEKGIVQANKAITKSFNTLQELTLNIRQ